MFIKENVFKTQSSKYHPTHVYKRKKNSRTKVGPGPTGPTSLHGRSCTFCGEIFEALQIAEKSGRVLQLLTCDIDNTTTSVLWVSANFQPRPQGAFPWLWAREKRPGDEVAPILFKEIMGPLIAVRLTSGHRWKLGSWLWKLQRNSIGSWYCSVLTSTKSF